MSYLKQTTKMGDWKKRIIEKKNRGRSETGRSKGIVATPLQKMMCRRNRSWKHPQYGAVMMILNGEKQRKGKKA
jgi:hypothetical protein